MFGLFKRKNNKFELLAPVTGRTIPLSEVADEVFAQKLAGDGIAIEPTGDIIVAPADGELTLVFKTLHAFALTLDNGVEILIHIGLETVSLNGEGFEQLVPQGTKVKAGTPIIKINKDLIKSKGLPLTTPVLITNPDITEKLNLQENIDVVAGKTPVVEYTIKK